MITVNQVNESLRLMGNLLERNYCPVFRPPTLEEGLGYPIDTGRAVWTDKWFDAPICVLKPADSQSQWAVDSFTRVDSEGITYYRLKLAGDFKVAHAFDDRYCAIVEHQDEGTNQHPGFKELVHWIDLSFRDPDNRANIMQSYRVTYVHQWAFSNGADPLLEILITKTYQNPSYSNVVGLFYPDRALNMEVGVTATLWKERATEAAGGPVTHVKIPVFAMLDYGHPAAYAYHEMGVAGIPTVYDAVDKANALVGFIEDDWGVDRDLYELYWGVGKGFVNPAKPYAEDAHWIHQTSTFEANSFAHSRKPLYGAWPWPSRAGITSSIWFLNSMWMYANVHFLFSGNAVTWESIYDLLHYGMEPAPYPSGDTGIISAFVKLNSMIPGPDGVRNWSWLGTPVFPNLPAAAEGEHGEHNPTFAFEYVITHKSFPLKQIRLTDWLVRFCIGAAYLWRYARSWDDPQAAEVEEIARDWALEAADNMLQLQVPWHGAVIDHAGREWNSIAFAGGIIGKYWVDNGVKKAINGDVLQEWLAGAAGRGGFPHFAPGWVPNLGGDPNKHGNQQGIYGADLAHYPHPEASLYAIKALLMVREILLSEA